MHGKVKKRANHHYRISLLPLWAFFTLLWLSVCPAKAFEEPLKRTIERTLEAYGGKAQIRKIKTVSAHGLIDDLLRKSSGGYARTMQRPDKLRIDIMPEKGGEVRILDGSTGLQGSGQKLSPANPISLSSMRYQFGYLDLPMSLADGTAEARHTGFRELHGRPMEVLSIQLANAPTLTIYVDFETNLIRRVEAIFNMGSMGSSLLGTEYHDFRMVDGVLFPFKLYNYAGTSNISIITITRLTVNKPLPGGSFPDIKQDSP